MCLRCCVGARGGGDLRHVSDHEGRSISDLLMRVDHTRGHIVSLILQSDDISAWRRLVV